MRYYLILGLVVMSVLLGCGKDYYNTFLISNNTNYQIQIKGFDRKTLDHINSPMHSETITIQPNSKFSVQKKKNGEDRQFGGIFLSMNIDSVIIIFDSKKIVKYACASEHGGVFCKDKRNILNFQEYYKKECGKNECTYSYTISDTDYDSAEIIK